MKDRCDSLLYRMLSMQLTDRQHSTFSFPGSPKECDVLEVRLLFPKTGMLLVRESAGGACKTDGSLRKHWLHIVQRVVLKNNRVAHLLLARDCNASAGRAAANGFRNAVCRRCRPYRGWVGMMRFDSHGSRRGLIAFTPTGVVRNLQSR